MNEYIRNCYISILVCSCAYTYIHTYIRGHAPNQTKMASLVELLFSELRPGLPRSFFLNFVEHVTYFFFTFSILCFPLFPGRMISLQTFMSFVPAYPLHAEVASAIGKSTCPRPWLAAVFAHCPPRAPKKIGIEDNR